MKHAIYIVIILLLAGFIFYQIRQAKIQQEFAFARNIQFNDAMEKAQNLAKMHADSADAERVKTRASDSIAIAASKLLAKRDATLTGIAQDQRKAVQTMIDTTKALNEFVASLDTVLEIRLKRIATLQKRIETDSVSFDKERAHLQAGNLETEKALKDAIIMASDNLELYQKAEKKAGKRWSVGAQAGYGITKDGLSPYLGVGVNFRILRF